jgi:uncharacterized membrane protein HdeD (DUF308 family)
VIADVLARNWWLLAVRGAVAILLGAFAILWPVQTIVLLALVFGAYMLIDGLVIGFYGVWGHRAWWLVVQGVLGVAVGIITLLIPSMTILVLIYLIAFWAILRGIAEIVMATRLGGTVGRELLWIAAGALSVAFGITVIFFPGAGMVAIVWVIGLYAIFLGILLLAAAFQVRGWARVGRPELT